MAVLLAATALLVPLFSPARTDAPRAGEPPEDGAASAAAELPTPEAQAAAVEPESVEPAAPAFGFRELPAADPPVAISALPVPAVRARSALVLDAGSGAVLYARNASQSLSPASLTKLATAVLAVETGNLHELVRIDRAADHRYMPESSVMGLRERDYFRLRDLLYGLLLPSGNDAAVAIARHLAGSEQRFVEQMNELARRLGMSKTHWEDPHGLGGEDAPVGTRERLRLRRGASAADDLLAPPAHVSTAYDLGILARYALAVPEIAEVVATRRHFAAGTQRIEMWNTNRLLWRYPGADGLKTGFTREAGRTLIVSATRDGHRLIVVLLDAKQRETEASRLLDWAFERFCWADAEAGCSDIPARP